MKITKLDGHAVTYTWNGEYGPESATTALCRCGWEESGSSKATVAWEYRNHLVRADQRDREALRHASNQALADWLAGTPAVIRASAGSYAAKALAEIERRLQVAPEEKTVQ